MFHVKHWFILLIFITACAAVGNVVNPNVHADGSEDLYIRSNPPGADCVLQNDSNEYKTKTPSYVTVKVDGDLKVSCSYQSTKKTCTLPSYTNYKADDTGLANIFTFKKTYTKELEAGDAYDNNACLDFSSNIDDGNCDDNLKDGSSSAGPQREQSACAIDPRPQIPQLMQDNRGKCLLPGAYCLEE